MSQPNSATVVAWQQAVKAALDNVAPPTGQAATPQDSNSLGARIASLAQANNGKGAGWCSKTNSSANSLGGNSFGSSCANSSGTGNGEYWCSDFAKWTWQNSGANVNGLTAGAGSFYTYGQQHNTLHTDNPQVGDAAVVQYTGGGSAAHVGVVTAVNPDGSIQVTNGDWNGNGARQVQFAQSSSVVTETWRKRADGRMYDSGGRQVSAYVSPAS